MFSGLRSRYTTPEDEGGRESEEGQVKEEGGRWVGGKILTLAMQILQGEQDLCCVMAGHRLLKPVPWLHLEEVVQLSTRAEVRHEAHVLGSLGGQGPKVSGTEVKANRVA